MMEIESKFGKVEIDPETIIKFERGILGFPEYKRYVVLDPDASSPLKLLQCIDNASLAFIVTNPSFWKPDYEIQIFKHDLEDIEATEADVDAIAYFVIVTIPANPKKMTANLKGPLLINSVKKAGKQLVLDSQKYSLKYRLIPGSDDE